MQWWAQAINAQKHGASWCLIGDGTEQRMRMPDWEAYVGTMWDVGRGSILSIAIRIGQGKAAILGHYCTCLPATRVQVPGQDMRMKRRPALSHSCPLAG